ncbi:MAG: RAD55 family ATPase [Candidatus Jordarchaeum sp.]|uniref:RAD55 family ATPase n=1 Tax=Candidatus Jordarchaeum sp. TaxID=2823881 RepID=UPI00404B4DA2
MSIKVATGIRELDAMLDGGILEGEVTLFLYDTGSGHNYILSEIIKNHCRMGGNVLLVLTSTSSSQFVTLTKNVINQKNCVIIDCISPRNVYNTEYYIENPSRAFDIFLSMKKAREDLNSRIGEKRIPTLVCFYSLSSLFINFEPNEVVQFFNKNVKESMRLGTVEYYTLIYGITEPSTEKRIQVLANTVILSRTEFRDHRRQNYLQILKHVSGVPYPEEKQYSITKRDGDVPEIVFSTPMLGRLKFS